MDAWAKNMPTIGDVTDGSAAAMVAEQSITFAEQRHIRCLNSEGPSQWLKAFTKAFIARDERHAQVETQQPPPRCVDVIDADTVQAMETTRFLEAVGYRCACHFLRVGEAGMPRVYLTAPF